MGHEMDLSTGEKARTSTDRNANIEEVAPISLTAETNKLVMHRFYGIHQHRQRETC